MASHQVTTSDGAVSFPQIDGDHSILQAALRAGVAFPYECSAGGCGSCRFTPVGGELEVLWGDAAGLSRRDRRKGMQLACQTRAASDLEIDVRLDESCRPTILPRPRSLRLETRRELSRDITEFGFSSEGRADFLPGQYAILARADGMRRCYSMSNLANDDGIWEFQIKLVPGGAFTEWLFDVAPGTRIDLDGPFGMAHLRPGSPRDVLCVAGGSGLSPMISIARGLAELESGDERRLHFFYGGRTRADICGYEDLVAAGLADRLDFVPVVSEPDDPLNVGWEGLTGFVHQAVIDRLGSSVAGMEVYFAGPPPMAEAMQRALVLDLRVPFEQLHFDRFF